MFTGIIEEVGKLKSIKHGANSSVLTIQASKVLEETKLGDSIAVNGVCLTVTGMDGGCFDADVMAESLRRTNLGDLTPGSPLNLERALALNSRLGGHIVSGHIDGTGTLVSFKKEDVATVVTIQTSPELLRYMLVKGSIAIDGVSLTITEVTDTTFSVSLIPHTKKETILLMKKTGDTVNLETDVIGKYVEKLLRIDKPEVQESVLDMDFLAENGFL
jgi:riboflavin synthase